MGEGITRELKHLFVGRKEGFAAALLRNFYIRRGHSNVIRSTDSSLYDQLAAFNDEVDEDVGDEEDVDEEAESKAMRGTQWHQRKGGGVSERLCDGQCDGHAELLMGSFLCRRPGGERCVRRTRRWPTPMTTRSRRQSDKAVTTR